MQMYMRTGRSVYRVAFTSPHEKVHFSSHGITTEPLIVNPHMASFPGSLIPLKPEKECTTCYGVRTRPTVSEVPATAFDRMFHPNTEYDAKLKRDDRMRFVKITEAVYEEERDRPWPVLASSQYGRRVHKPVEKVNRNAARINHLRNEIVTFKGIGLPPIEICSME